LYGQPAADSRYRLAITRRPKAVAELDKRCKKIKSLKNKIWVFGDSEYKAVFKKMTGAPV
jgi:hypothetical protein